MKKKTIGKGMGKTQANTRIENRVNILKVLIDEQWHRYKEIREKAKVSNVTLSAHLKELKLLLERKEDKKTYPTQVSYKITPLLKMELIHLVTLKTAWEEIEENYFRGKDLKSVDLTSVLECINALDNSLLVTMIDSLELNKELRENAELRRLFLETFVWESYKTLTWKLVEAYRKIIREKLKA